MPKREPVCLTRFAGTARGKVAFMNRLQFLHVHFFHVLSRPVIRPTESKAQFDTVHHILSRYYDYNRRLLICQCGLQSVRRCLGTIMLRNAALE